MHNFIRLVLFLFCCNLITAQSKDDKSLLGRLSSFSNDVTQEEISSKLKNLHTIPKDELADFYIALANYQQVIFRDYKKANENYHLALAQSIITEYNKADALNGIATVYSYYFHNDLAIKNYKKALAIIKKNYSDSIIDINSIYSNIGHVFSKENHVDSATYYYRKAIDFGKLKNKPALGAYFNLGNIIKNQDSAYSYTKQALASTIALNKEYLLTFCYLNLGSIEVNRHNLKEADSLLMLSKNNAIKFKQIPYINEIEIQRARSLIANNKITEGIALLNSVKDYFVKENNYKQLEIIYLNLEKAFLKNGNFEEAHKALKKYYQNLDNKEKSKKLKYTEGFEFYKEWKQQLDIKNRERAKDKLFYVIIIISLIILISFVVVFFFKYRKEQKAQNDIITHKNVTLHSKVDTLKDKQLLNHQQLLFKNILVDEKQNFLKQLLEDLKEISKDSNANTRKKILSLHQKIQMNIKDDVSKEFEYYFEKVHPTFYKTINEKGFTLSKNEMRLAALIKLNFNTKEISDITKQTTNTIYVAKSRLKNKLDLSKEDSLYDFFQRI
ncbi:tetratricopeptide repeat protein [Aquimarina rhabdastrellae]